jgi:acetolactate synthase-1/2/3 large subunit
MNSQLKTPTEAMPDQMTGAHALMRSLIAEGVKVIFGYPGGAIMPVYDALYDYRDQLRHILVRHEQGASHAAEGYARMTGEPGVCMATSGPGATNLVTGIADAMLDSIPMVAITGQVAKGLLGTDAFQETDIIGITIPITKWNYQVTEASEIPAVIAKAFHIARSGRPGPVLIDITKNAQLEMMNFSYEKVTHLKSTPPPRAIKADEIARAAALINGAERPLMFVGHGVLISKAEKAVVEFAEKGNIPVASTLHGLSSFPTGHRLYTGMLGMHGNYGPNLLTDQADVIIAVGMRFDDRVTGDLSKYARNARIVHIEIDHAEINKNMKAEVPLHADAKEALTQLTPLIEARNRDAWLQRFTECTATEYEKVIKQSIYPTQGALKMSEVVRVLSEKSGGAAVVVADVGQHQMMAARYYRFTKPDSYITSGGLGTMGFALPAALGCKVATPEREVIAIIGDGGFQMTFQELGTIAQEKTGVKVVILNNNYLGMVRQWQELFFDNRYSFVQLDNPDFVKLAGAFSIDAERVSERGSLEKAVERMLETKGPYLLEIMCEKEQNVFPMVPAGAAASDIRLE